MKSFKYALTPIISLFIFCGLIVSSPLSAKPPESSGPYVSRYGEYSFWTYWANGMIVFVGADIPAYCQGDFPFGLWDYQEIESPADIDLIMSVSKGDDIPTFVYPDSIYWENPCANGDEDLWIVSGTSDAIYTDNDMNAAENYHSRANSWGVSAHGVLFSQDGDPVSFSGGFHCVFKNNENPAKAWEKCKNRLSLTD